MRRLPEAIKPVRRTHRLATHPGTIRLQANDNRVRWSAIRAVARSTIGLRAWDISRGCLEAALHAGVLERDLVNQLKPQLQAVKPMKAVFDQHYVKRLNGTHVKRGADKFELAKELMQDIENFKRANGCDRLVMVWCASTEIFKETGEEHDDIASFERAMRENSPAIAPSMSYAYAALKSGVPFANGAPNLTVDVRA